MCMVASVVTRQYGLLAADSAQYDTQVGETTFHNLRVFVADRRTVFSFVGTHLYLASVDKQKLYMPLDALVLYLKDHFKKVRPDVDKLMKEHIKDPDENEPHFCLFALGMLRGYPTVVQLNSFLDFEPKWTWTKDQPKFASLIYGDDSKPEKQHVFKETTRYMEKKVERLGKTITPGLLAEVLTRGIYRKADLEQKIGLKKKYAGGAVNVVAVNAAGAVPLSGYIVV